MGFYHGSKNSNNGSTRVCFMRRFFLFCLDLKTVAGFPIKSKQSIPITLSLTPSRNLRQAAMPSNKGGGWWDVQSVMNARHPGHGWSPNKTIARFVGPLV